MLAPAALLSHPTEHRRRSPRDGPGQVPRLSAALQHGSSRLSALRSADRGCPTSISPRRGGVPPWLLIAGGLVAVGAIVSAEQDTATTPGERVRRDSVRPRDRAELDARVICQMTVRDCLRAPKTADFGGYEATTARPETGQPGFWIVNGTVTAVNAFNAPLTSPGSARRT
jgi:hypothetical protein